MKQLENVCSNRSYCLVLDTISDMQSNVWVEHKLSDMIFTILNFNLVKKISKVWYEMTFKTSFKKSKTSTLVFKVQFNYT